MKNLLFLRVLFVFLIYWFIYFCFLFDKFCGDVGCILLFVGLWKFFFMKELLLIMDNFGGDIFVWWKVVMLGKLIFLVSGGFICFVVNCVLFFFINEVVILIMSFCVLWFWGCLILKEVFCGSCNFLMVCEWFRW